MKIDHPRIDPFPDCVLGYHLNPLTCGIAKFNQVLAEQLGVPVLGVFSPEAVRYRRPLLSIKISEFTDEHAHDLAAAVAKLDRTQSLRLFLHAYSGTPVEAHLLASSDIVYCGNGELAMELSALHARVVEAWCPGAIFDQHRFPKAEVSIFSFGMAHKVRADYYYRLRDLLERTGKSYCLYLSTALHEGTSFEGSFSAAYDEMREIFADRIYFLGFISDTSVYNYLLDTTYFAAFFERGVRANNTSVNAALQCGATVLTNLDDHSPPAFRHMDNIIDLRQCADLPTDAAVLTRIAGRAKETAVELGWEALIGRMTGGEAAERVVHLDRKRQSRSDVK